MRKTSTPHTNTHRGDRIGEEQTLRPPGQQEAPEGRAGDAIVEISKEDVVDLIVMECRELSGIIGFVLGSVSRHVVENCTKPILIVK